MKQLPPIEKKLQVQESLLSGDLLTGLCAVWMQFCSVKIVQNNGPKQALYIFLIQNKGKGPPGG